MTTLHCPRCQTLTTWQDNPYRPFCSERCKLIDLGAWASDEYRVASDEIAMPSNDDMDDD